jgi:hypothetical protein
MPLELIVGCVGSGRRVGKTKLTDFRVLLCLCLFPQSVATRLGLPVEDEVLRYCPSIIVKVSSTRSRSNVFQTHMEPLSHSI